MQLQEALETALAFEHKIRDLYADSSRKTKDTKGQRIFAILAREEQVHVEHLQAMLAHHRETGEIKEMELTSLLPAPQWLEAEAKKLAEAAKTAKVSTDQFHTELDLLKDALEIERQASGMYADLVARLPEAQRPAFARFLEIENGHVSIVQAEIDALAGHGHWFDFMEFSLEQ